LDGSERRGIGAQTYQETKFRVVAIVQEYLEGRFAAGDDSNLDRLRDVISRTTATVLSGAGLALTAAEREQLKVDVFNEIRGLGPLEALLTDTTVDDIIVNGADKVYVEREGVLTRTPVRFRDNSHLMNIVQRIVGPLGRRVDETSPFVDARLPDGSRVNVVIPPVAIDGPSISIRKFKRTPLTGHDLIRLGTMSEAMLEYLGTAVRSRANIMIAGGTGSGKSTLLNVLSSFISPTERLVTIEDAAELQLQQPHVVRLETRMANPDGNGEITARSILRNTLRMRPDRILVGEVRGGEAVEMLQAMTTGHDGSMTTIHANSARDALSRLELLFGFGGLNVDLLTIRRQIASAINVIVHLRRHARGHRRVVEVVEVAGFEENTILLNSIFEEAARSGSAGDFVRSTRRSIYSRPAESPAIGSGD